MNSVKNPNKIKKALAEFAKDVPTPDESVQSLTEFKATVYAGVVPAYTKMADFIKRWLA